MFSKVATSARLGFLLAPLALFGCSHTVTASDGTKVTVEPGAKIETTDSQGNTATVSGDGKKMTIKSSNGASEYVADNGTVKAHDSQGNTLEMGTGVSEADLGLPFYPGSTESKDSLKSATDKGTTVMSNRVTTDAAAKVVDFYTGKLGKPASSMTTDTMAMATWKSGKKAETLMVSKDGTSNKISVTVATTK